jgi:hypothetical protein
MGTAAARVDDAFGDALMIEMKNFLAKNEILQQGWTARAAFEAILVVADRDAVVGSEHRRVRIVGDLVGFAARRRAGFLASLVHEELSVTMSVGAGCADHASNASAGIL